MQTMTGTFILVVGYTEEGAEDYQNWGTFDSYEKAVEYAEEQNQDPEGWFCDHLIIQHWSGDRMIEAWEAILEYDDEEIPEINFSPILPIV